MALDRAIYRAIEDIDGPDNISGDPAILDSYMDLSIISSSSLGFFLV